MVVPRFVTQALANNPITVYGDGSNSRCFTHVDDAVRALLGLMDTDATIGQVYNIGSCQETTILELARRVRLLTGSSSEISFVPFSVAYEDNFEDMPRRVPSIKKVEQTIGWQPQLDLDAILLSVIEYAQTTQYAARPLARHARHAQVHAHRVPTLKRATNGRTAAAALGRVKSPARSLPVH
jgi:UDP-glucose 4-epimerase